MPLKWTKPKEMSKTKLRQLDVTQNQCLYTIAEVYKLTPIAVLEHEMGFLPIQMHLKKTGCSLCKKDARGLAKKHIKRECNAIQATIAHHFRPKTKPLMRPIGRDKFKRMAAAITETDVWPADLFKAQHRKSKRAKIQKAFKERWKREWEKYQSTLTYYTTAQAKP